MLSSTEKELALQVHMILDEFYEEKLGLLEAHTLGAYQLLIAVILSAQTTDRQVNLITPALFERYPTPLTLADANQVSVEHLIRSTGFYHAKARNIIGAAKALNTKFDGKVPQTMKELVTLPGVGRKTAGVVLGSIFGQPAIIVDTHFKRVVKRIGLTQQTDPVKVEYEIATILEERYHYRFSMTVNTHGREYCNARKPACERCPIADVCRKVGV